MKNNVVHRIVQGDCLEVMKKIPNDTVSFICADFPYNISNNPWLTMRNDKIVKADFWEWDKFESDEVYLDFVFSVCDEYKRILKPNWSLVLFFSYQYSWWIGYELKKEVYFLLEFLWFLKKLIHYLELEKMVLEVVMKFEYGL